jgi:uncharacterized protein (DUF488 family)
VTVLPTFGHGTAIQEKIAGLLNGAGVRSLVDIRTAPGSRRSPHVARDELQRWLSEYNIRYRWEQRLGGWRKGRADSPDKAHTPSDLARLREDGLLVYDAGQPALGQS